MHALGYIAQTAILLAAFWLAFRLLLRNQALHALNRAVLLGSIALSFALPLCVIRFPRPEADLPSAGLLARVPAQTADVAVQDAAMPSPAAGAPWWQTALVLVYAIGLAAVAFYWMYAMACTRQIIRRSERLPDRGPYHVRVTDEIPTPFSWMRTAVIPRVDYESSDPEILQHELLHCRYAHSLDALAAHLLVAGQWFNPAAWLLRRDLLAVHEFQVDAALMRQGTPAKPYFEMLLARATQAVPRNAVAHFLSGCELRDRIRMAGSKASERRHGWRALAFVPLVAVALALNARTVPAEVDPAQLEFEQKYLDAQSAGADGAIRLIGYRTLRYAGPDAEVIRQGVLNNPEAQELMGYTYFEDRDSVVIARLYFPLANAVVCAGNDTFIAAQDGSVPPAVAESLEQITVYGKSASGREGYVTFDDPLQPDHVMASRRSIVYRLPAIMW